MRGITVLKGQVLAGAVISKEQAWQPYRERDELREVDVHLCGKDMPDGGLTFRGVQMRRGDSRHPHTTLFATNAHEDDLPAEYVANYYLLRWPRQEQVFRKARDGAGLDHSHGYSGGEVQHVALVPKLEQAELSVAAAKKRLEKATATRTDLKRALVGASLEARKPAMALADKQVRAMQKQSKRREAEQADLKTMPDQIYARDMGRDSIMTCLKLTLMGMLEFSFKEHFGGVAMEWRTFITQLVAMPVTVRTREDHCIYQLHGNPRHPALMADLDKAVAEINRRRLYRGKHRLIFEVLPAVARGS